MVIHDKINSVVPDLAHRMAKEISDGYHVDTTYSLGLAGRIDIYDILDSLLSVLFPGSYCRETPKGEDLEFYINNTLRKVSYLFYKHLKEIFAHDEKDDSDCDKKVIHVVETLLTSLPKIREDLLKDIATAYNGDPAASSFDEIVLSYPFVEAVATHRIAHLLYQENVPLVPRIMAERAHSRTGIDIHPGASIKPGFFIDHGTGVVIGETCRIGTNVKIYQGVTLGAVSPFDRDGNPRTGEKRHPDIEDDVIIYAGATILGGRTVIGKGAIVGGNTWITKSIPPGAVVYRECTNLECQMKIPEKESRQSNSKS